MNNNTNKIAAIYTRVSTTYQEEANSLEKQKERCFQEAKEKGYKFSQIYIDVESGSKDDRTGFLEMLSDMKEYKFHRHSICGKKESKRCYICNHDEYCKKSIDSESLEKYILDQIINFNSNKTITDISYLK